MAKDALAQVSDFLQMMERAKEVSEWQRHFGTGRGRGVAALRSDRCPCRHTRSWQRCWTGQSCP